VHVASSGLHLANETLTEAKRGHKVALGVNISERYATDEMHTALAYLGRRRDEYSGDSQKMADAYAAEVVGNGMGSPIEWDRARRRLSRYFVSTRAFCEAGLLDEAILAQHLGKSACDMCTVVVAVLDQAHTHRVMNRKDYDPQTGVFFGQLRRRHFGDV
jgi:hypothetical protein